MLKKNNYKNDYEILELSENKFDPDILAKLRINLMKADRISKVGKENLLKADF